MLLTLKSHEMNMANLFLIQIQKRYVMSIATNTLTGIFEVKGIKYLIDENDIDDLPPQSTDEYSADPIQLDMEKIKQLQQ